MLFSLQMVRAYQHTFLHMTDADSEEEVRHGLPAAKLAGAQVAALVSRPP